MRLTTLLGAIGASSAKGAVRRVEVAGISVDSRTIRPGELFFAIDGSVTDGHEYLKDVRKKEAVGAVVSRLVENCPLDQFLVEDTREALALAACEFYDHPSEKFPLVGITGTNGKTTTSYLVDNILSKKGLNSGLVGTINYCFKNEVIPAGLTTPGSVELQSLLDKMVSDNVDYLVLEVSSHSLSQHRVDYIDFDLGVFTNLTQDHLDYHRTMDDYFNTKAKLF
ncbi:MAG: UDP-N-acetylmuramoyl-L-alanyl-D-glutamate--2,6-diaminopimelate ligase, partial [Desulfobacteraceae bacterium]|nr:UDP-N-acetylmuramoyl-L-alanyl-D-glutamate--2,6-diaminopimelate ligase [Desulfobacteraceae bacterium]